MESYLHLDDAHFKRRLLYSGVYTISLIACLD